MLSVNLYWNGQLVWTPALGLYLCVGDRGPGTVSSGIYRPPFCAVGTNVRRWLSYSHWQAYIHYAFIRQMASFLCLAYISRLTPKCRMICRLTPKSCVMYAGLRLAKTFVCCCPDQLNKRLTDSKNESVRRKSCSVRAKSTFVVASSQSQRVAFMTREAELIDMWQARPVLFEVISKGSSLPSFLSVIVHPSWVSQAQAPRVLSYCADALVFGP